MTAVSDEVSRDRRFDSICRLARRLRVGAFMLQFCIAATGCIVAPPPPHEDSKQTSPILLVAQAVPPITRVVNIPSIDTPYLQEFAVPVRSEDDGDRLVGVLIASYAETTEVEASRATAIEPATFGDPAREIRVTWNYRGYDPGCYQLTLVVTHEKNFDIETFRPKENFDDVAIVTWWVNLADDPPGSTPVDACPDVPALRRF